MSDKPTQTALARLIGEAVVLAGGKHQCTVLGHDWQHIGGANAGCGPGCACSVPVHECRTCGDCDYGDNEEADGVRRACEQRRVWCDEMEVLGA
jgi:hypothetical protein